MSRKFTAKLSDGTTLAFEFPDAGHGYSSPDTVVWTAPPGLSVVAFDACADDVENEDSPLP